MVPEARKPMGYVPWVGTYFFLAAGMEPLGIAEYAREEVWLKWRDKIGWDCLNWPRQHLLKPDMANLRSYVPVFTVKWGCESHSATTKTLGK
jgi:hypothetical protein